LNPPESNNFHNTICVKKNVRK